MFGAIGHSSWMLKKLLKRFIPEETLGILDYYRSPDWSLSLGGAFNGQRIRTAIFLSLCRELSPAAIVETGTHVGTTTEFVARAIQVPIFTVESNRRLHGYAKHRLRRYPHVALATGDSRAFLGGILAGGDFKQKPALFYLDAHWGEDLPLGEELEIIFRSCRSAVVIVDDFEVPGDSGYQFDDYGAGKALTRNYVAPIVERYGLIQFFPAVRSEEETGKRRGCIVLAQEGAAADAARRVSDLRLWE